MLGGRVIFIPLLPADRPVFAALGQTSRRDFNIEVPSFESCPPGGVLALRATGLKVQEPHSAISWRRLLENQQLRILKRAQENTEDSYIIEQQS